MSKQALGKGLSELGLDVLLSRSSLSSSQWQQVPLSSIDPDPRQPRQHYDEESLMQLTESIRIHGVLQPIVLTPVGKRYQIVAGERRFRAAQMAGLLSIPACCRTFSEEDAKIVALVENLQRADLSALEQACAIDRLIEAHGLTHQAVAEAIGASRSHVTNLLRLLSLSDRVKEALLHAKIDMGHARCLLGLPCDEQEMWLELIEQQHWSVRRLETALRLAHKTPRALNTQEPKCVVRASGDAYVLKLNTSSKGLVEAIQALIASWHES